MLIERSQYSVFKKVILRILLIYFILYIIPYGFEYIPIDTDDYSLWEQVTIWFGETFFGWEFDPDRLYKGFDSKYDFSRFTLIGVVSLSGAFIWLFLDRKMSWEYNSRLKSVLQTILRYHLGFTLILYGIAKVYPLQFGSTGLDRLSTEFGDFHPMNLLWAFMSYSRFYTSVTGWVEVLGGIFLLFRKSTFLGIFLCFVAMVNVVVIDIGYDVTVKMFAIHLLIMSFILLMDHYKRIVNFLVLNQVVKPFRYFYLFEGKPMLGIILKLVVISTFTYFTISGTSDRLEVETKNTNSYLSSTHRVRKMIVNGDTLENTDSRIWEKINISASNYSKDFVSVKVAGERSKFYKLELDSVIRRIKFIDRNVESDIYDFEYELLPNKRYIFRGYHLGDSIIISTEARVQDDFFLVRNQRRWIRDL